MKAYVLNGKYYVISRNYFWVSNNCLLHDIANRRRRQK
jgi:hypothetical protein